MDIGNGLKKLRKEKGLNQVDFAKKVDVSQTYISDLERNLKNPTVNTMAQIIEPFEISYIDFLTDYAGIEKEKKTETTFDLLNEENQKQVSDYIEFLLARQSFK